MDDRERRRLMDRIRFRRGSLDELEACLAALRTGTPWFDGSDEMLSLQRAVESFCAESRLVPATQTAIGRDELIALVKKIQRADGTEAEIDAALSVVKRNVPHPEVSDLIFWPEGSRRPRKSSTRRSRTKRNECRRRVRSPQSQRRAQSHGVRRVRRDERSARVGDGGRRTMPLIGATRARGAGVC
jgi:hypothetical protein